MPIRGDKAIEIRQIFGETVADTLDAMERDAAHGCESGDGGCLHVDKGGAVGGSQTEFFGSVCNPGTGH